MSSLTFKASNIVVENPVNMHSLLIHLSRVIFEGSLNI